MKNTSKKHRKEKIKKKDTVHIKNKKQKKNADIYLSSTNIYIYRVRHRVRQTTKRRLFNLKRKIDYY